MGISKDNHHNTTQEPLASVPIFPCSEPADWKAIAYSWEILRIPFNLIIGLAGLTVLDFYREFTIWQATQGILTYAFLANVMFMLGPITEMYLNWIVDFKEGKFVPKAVQVLIRSPFLSRLLFIAGCCYALKVTYGATV